MQKCICNANEFVGFHRNFGHFDNLGKFHWLVMSFSWWEQSLEKAARRSSFLHMAFANFKVIANFFYHLNGERREVRGTDEFSYVLTVINFWMLQLHFRTTALVSSFSAVLALSNFNSSPLIITLITVWTLEAWTLWLFHFIYTFFHLF